MVLFFKASVDKWYDFGGQKRMLTFKRTIVAFFTVVLPVRDNTEIAGQLVLAWICSLN